MNKIHFAVVCLVSLFITACGLSGGGTELKIKVGGKERTLSGKASYVHFSEVSPIGATFDIASFEPKKVDGKTVAFDDLKSDDQILVEFNIIGGKESGLEIKPGEYILDGESGTNRASSVVITYRKERTFGYPVLLKNGKGKVTISSVSEDSISGTIDVSDSDNFINGNFTSKLLKNEKK